MTKVGGDFHLTFFGRRLAIRWRCATPWHRRHGYSSRLSIGWSDTPHNDFRKIRTIIEFRFKPDFQHYRFLYLAHPWLKSLFPYCWYLSAELSHLQRDKLFRPYSLIGFLNNKNKSY